MTRGGNNQLAKCEWNLELASNFLNLLARMPIFPPHTESFSPLIESYSSPIPKYKHLTRWFIIIIIMTRTLYKCSPKTWFWRVFLWFGEWKFWVTCQSGECLENLNSTPDDYEEISVVLPATPLWICLASTSAYQHRKKRYTCTCTCLEKKLISSLMFLMWAHSFNWQI
jgi:hypothetical protein